MADRAGPVTGWPAYEATAMVSTTTTGSKIMIEGDFQAGHVIGDRLGITVELIPHLFGATNRFPTGQRGFFAYGRTGAAVVIPNALRYLEVL
jgi:HK97 family phage major capsid protein